MPNGVHASCTAGVSPLGRRWPPLPSLTLWLHPSFMFKLTLGAEAGRQGASLPPRLQRCGPAVSRLIQSNLPLSRAGTPGWSPPILTPRGAANNSALVNTTNSTPGGELFASEISLDSSLEIKPNHVTRALDPADGVCAMKEDGFGAPS